MNALQDSLLELIRRTSAEIPDDVHQAILDSLEREKQGTIAASAMKIIEQNIALAKNKSQPICQDTGSIIFYVDCPVGYDQLALRAGRARSREARPPRRGSSGRTRWTRSPARTTAPTWARARPRFTFTSIARPRSACGWSSKAAAAKTSARNTRCPTKSSRPTATWTAAARRFSTRCCRRRARAAGRASWASASAATAPPATSSRSSSSCASSTTRNPNPELDKLETGHRRDRQQARHRADGFRRQDHLAGRQDRRAQSPARLLFRQHQLHVLGVSETRCNFRNEWKNSEMAVLSLKTSANGFAVRMNHRQTF